MKWRPLALLPLVFLAACGGSVPDLKYQRAAALLVERADRKVKIAHVRCSRPESHRAGCIVRAKSGTVYSCDVEVDTAAVQNNACFWRKHHGWVSYRVHAAPPR